MHASLWDGEYQYQLSVYSVHPCHADMIKLLRLTPQAHRDGEYSYRTASPRYIYGLSKLPSPVHRDLIIEHALNCTHMHACKIECGCGIVSLYDNILPDNLLRTKLLWCNLS